MTTSAMTAEAMARKAARGEYTGGYVPYGWSVGDDGVSLIPRVDEQRSIRVARELAAAGLSLRKVGAMLAERGILPRTGTSWHQQKVKLLIAARLDDGGEA